jgi:hypothetical protein
VIWVRCSGRYIFFLKSGDEVRTVVAIIGEQVLLDALRLVPGGPQHLTPLQSADARMRRDMGSQNPDVLNASAA